jgi:hypothetical protein
MGSDAAESAADTQAGATRAGIEEQRRQYDIARQDQAPFRRTGVAANTRLARLLGLDTAPGGADAGPVSAPTTFVQGQSDDPVWERLLAQFNAGHAAQYGIPMNRPWDSDAGAQAAYMDLQNRYAAEVQAQRATAAPASADPEYGSLLKRFGLSDLAADPVYQTGLKFGLDQGTQGINSRAIRSGMYDSGATLKELTRYGTDYGNQRAGEAYNRFNNDQTNIFNRLSGISGTGQTATNQVQAAGSNMANNVTSLLGQEGNARSAGIVGGANAWGNALTGIGNAANNYQSNQTLERLIGNRGRTGFDPMNYGYADEYNS